MSKKLLFLSIIFIIITLLFNISYATDILMDLEENNATSSQNSNVTNTENETQLADNTIINSSEESTTDQENIDDTYAEYDPATTTTTDYEESSELSIPNIINIVLVSVGIVLILLGIAIIIKLK